MPMIVPVSMPGIASGSTWCNTICIFDAPRPSAASRIDGGTAVSAARDAMMITGSVIRLSTSPPTSGAERGKPNTLMNSASPSKPEHDRRHGGEVVDVDLDQVGPAIARRELFEIDRRRNAERKRQRERDEQHEERADRRAPDARELGIARIAAREEVAIELQRRRVLAASSAVSQPSCRSSMRRSALGHVARRVTLDRARRRRRRRATTSCASRR